MQLNRYLQLLEKSKWVWNEKTDWQARKIITTIQRKNCSRSKKENFVNIKNIEISSRWSLQYLNNSKAFKQQKN